MRARRAAHLQPRPAGKTIHNTIQHNTVQYSTTKYTTKQAVILYCEPSRDIRYHSNNFYYNIPLATVKQQNYTQTVLFLTLCYIQKVGNMETYKID